MKRFLAAAALLCAAALLAPQADAAGGQRVFFMAAQNGSGENGSVVLTPLGDQTRVVINVANAPEAAIQLVHFHIGPCARLDAKVLYPLRDAVDGSSTTVLKLPIATLLSGGFAVNMHQMGKPTVYTSCADIK
ncbi:MAG: hypothetical protein GIW95_09000 [Candidatus Eremiobacteraeota bacterium]|nr:hypothetical protein [Candidatus Eremiobacteraeota bacterium]